MAPVANWYMIRGNFGSWTPKAFTRPRNCRESKDAVEQVIGAMTAREISRKKLANSASAEATRRKPPDATRRPRFGARRPTPTASLPIVSAGRTRHEEGNMGGVLWLIAVVVVIIGVVQLFQGQVLLGIIMLVAAAAIGPGGFSIFRRRHT